MKPHRAPWTFRTSSQRLAVHLTAWQATTFLVGEFPAPEREDHPVFTVADSLIVLNQTIERNSVVRKLRVASARTDCPSPRLPDHAGWSQGLSPASQAARKSPPSEIASPAVAPVEQRLSTGVSGLDEMLGGGIPRGYSVMIAGPSRLG